MNDPLRLVHSTPNVAPAPLPRSACLRIALRRTLVGSGLMQVDFAEELGISVDTLSRWLTGRTDMRPRVVLDSSQGARFARELVGQLEERKAA